MHMVEHMIKCDCCGNTAVAVSKTEPCGSENGTITCFRAPEGWHEGFNRNNVHICPECFNKLNPKSNLSSSESESNSVDTLEVANVVMSLCRINDFCCGLECPECYFYDEAYLGCCLIRCTPETLDTYGQDTRYRLALGRLCHGNLEEAIANLTSYCMDRRCKDCILHMEDRKTACLCEAHIPACWIALFKEKFSRRTTTEDDLDYSGVVGDQDFAD